MKYRQWSRVMLSAASFPAERGCCHVAWCYQHLAVSPRHAMSGIDSPVRADSHSYSLSPGSCPDDVSPPSTPVHISQSQHLSFHMSTNQNTGTCIHPPTTIYNTRTWKWYSLADVFGSILLDKWHVKIDNTAKPRPSNCHLCDIFDTDLHLINLKVTFYTTE